MVNTTHAEETAGAKGTPISKGTDVLSFWVNKIRFRTRKSAMSSVLGGYSWVRGVGGGGGGETMLVGFVDRRYSLRSVAKTDHSVSTIFYWRTLDLLYNKRLIRFARAKSDGRRKVRTNHVANCCCRGGSRIPGDTSSTTRSFSRNVEGPLRDWKLHRRSRFPGNSWAEVGFIYVWHLQRDDSDTALIGNNGVIIVTFHIFFLDDLSYYL